MHRHLALVCKPGFFIHDWGAFFLMFTVWLQTGRIAKQVGFPLHMRSLINADRAIARPFLHGILPQVWLQQQLYHPGHWQWYDKISWLVYVLHFPHPFIIGFIIKSRSQETFQRFSTAFLTLATMSFIGYIFYPAVPPWMAWSRFHAIAPVQKLIALFNDDVLKICLGRYCSYKNVFKVKYNLEAAMPSFHSALPVLSMLYLHKTFGKWSLLMLCYTFVVWFSLIYTAEHWIVDEIAGVICASLDYLLVETCIQGDCLKWLGLRRLTKIFVK